MCLMSLGNMLVEIANGKLSEIMITHHEDSARICLASYSKPVAVLFLPNSRGIFHSGMFIPPVET
jgi:hypothetical protein